MSKRRIEEIAVNIETLMDMAVERAMRYGNAECLCGPATIEVLTGERVPDTLYRKASIAGYTDVSLLEEMAKQTGWQISGPVWQTIDPAVQEKEVDPRLDNALRGMVEEIREGEKVALVAMSVGGEDHTGGVRRIGVTREILCFNLGGKNAPQQIMADDKHGEDLVVGVLRQAFKTEGVTFLRRRRKS